MEIDEDKIDDAVLALLWLTPHNERCAWKSFDWDVTSSASEEADCRPCEQDEVLADEGLQRSEELFRALFTRPRP